MNEPENVEEEGRHPVKIQVRAQRVMPELDATGVPTGDCILLFTHDFIDEFEDGQQLLAYLQAEELTKVSHSPEPFGSNQVWLSNEAMAPGLREPYTERTARIAPDANGETRTAWDYAVRALV